MKFELEKIIVPIPFLAAGYCIASYSALRTALVWFIVFFGVYSLIMSCLIASLNAAIARQARNKMKRRIAENVKAEKQSKVNVL